jgi:hypothetical protein
MGASYLYFQKTPLGWRDAPAVVALAAHIRKRDPRLFLLDLWDWAKCHGDTHPLVAAADAIERGAGWRGKRGVLYAGLVATGWVAEVNEHAIILDWEEEGIVRGRPTLVGVVPQGESILDEEGQRKLKDRIRQKKCRDKKKPVTDDSVTCHKDSVTERDSGVTDASNSLESAVYDGFVTPKSKEKEEDKEDSKNLALFADATNAGLGEKKPRGRPPKETPEIVTDRERWLARARALVGLTPEETPPGKELCVRFAQVRKQRGMDQLMRSLEGLEGDPWASRQGLQTLLSASLIERGLAKWNKGASTLHVNRIQHGVGPVNLDDMYAEDGR